MPWIISVLLGGLLRIVSSVVGRVIVALGFGYVEFVGVSSLVEAATDSASSYVEAIGASSLAAWAGFFRVDVHFSIILSAIGAKLLLNSLTGGSFRRLVQK